MKSIIVLLLMGTLFSCLMGKKLKVLRRTTTYFSCECVDLNKEDKVQMSRFEYQTRSLEKNADLTIYLHFHDNCNTYSLYFEGTKDTLIKIDSIEGHDIFSSDSLRAYMENGNKKLWLRIQDTCLIATKEFRIVCKKMKGKANIH